MAFDIKPINFRLHWHVIQVGAWTFSQLNHWQPVNTRGLHETIKMFCRQHSRVHFRERKPFELTHWGRVTYICVGKLISIGSDNGLSPGRRQAIIWTNAGILLIGPLETNFSAIVIEIHSFSFKKMHLKMSSAKGRLFSLGLNELNVNWSGVYRNIW